MRVVLFVLMICICCVNTLFSQDLNFVNINADMGLPSNECYRVAQDANGYIWIATESGLVKYNSRDFILFNAAKGMPTNAVYALDADKKGRLWFATGNWKVGYILNDTVHLLNEANFFNEATKKGDVIYKIKYNESSNSLFVSSHHQTVEIFVNEGMVFSKTTNVSATAKDFVFMQHNNEIYVANQFNYTRSPEKIYKYNTSLVYGYFNQSDSLLFPVPKQSTFFSEAFSVTNSKGYSAIALLDFLFVLNKEKKIIATRKLPAQVQSLYIDKQNNIWVGCKKNGVLIFKDVAIQIAMKHELQELSVSNILEDSEGGMWIATLEKGIFYCSNKNIAIDRKIFNAANGVNFSKVVNNKLFLSNDNVALAMLGEDTTLLQRFSQQVKSNVTDVHKTKDGYIITTVLGIYRTDENLKKVYQYIPPSKTFIGAMGLVAGEGEPLLAYLNIGFYYLNGLKFNFSYSGSEKIKHAIFTKKKQLVFVSRNGLFTLRSNTFDYNGAKPISKIIENEFAQNNILNRLNTCPIPTPAAQSAKNVNKLYEDSYGNIWLPASSDTLTVLNSSFNIRKQIVTGEKNINCRNVLQINATNFLVSTNKGVLQINFSDTTFANYKLQYFNKTNGLPSSDVYNIVKFKNSYYVNTSKGLCFFPEPENLKHQHYPNTVINAFTINDSIIPVTSNTTVSYKQNNVSFQIDALTYKKITQRGVFFKYKLEGFDEEFKTANSNIISYNNLLPGTYKFIAKAFYEDDTEDLTPAECSFTIRPPFWQTWWGILIILSGAYTAMFLFIQQRIKKIKMAAAEKAAINKTIAEYKFTALKAQMNPHFVFNSINVIQNLILDKDKTEAYNALGKFSKLIRSILHQSDSVFATIEEEINLIDLYIELNQLRINYPFIFKKEIQSKTLDYSIPSLIIQPFIENALWHGIIPYKGEKQGVIYLRIFTTEENILTIEIEDNGIGRKAAELRKAATSLHESKGIELIKERLNAYKSMNNNNLAELKIIDLQENNEPKGTLIQLKISIVHEE